LHSSRNFPNPERVRGWILDVYPSALGEFAVWIITENGERVRLTDSFKPRIYVSGKEDGLEKLPHNFCTIEGSFHGILCRDMQRPLMPSPLEF